MSGKPMTVAQAYALAYVEAVRRTNENRKESQARISLPSPPKDQP